MPIDQYGIKYDEPRKLDFNRQEATRQLSADSGDVGSTMDISNKNAEAVAGNVPDASSQFSNAMVSMLKQYQTMGTKPIQEQNIGLQQQQLGRVQAESTPGMSPSQQGAIRSGEAGALEPSITGSAQRAQTFGEQISGFGNVLSNVQNLMSKFEENKAKQKQDAENTIKDIQVQYGASGFKALDDQTKARLEKEAGWGKGMIDKLAQISTLAEQKQAADIAAEKEKNRISSIKSTTGASGGTTGTYKTTLDAMIGNAYNLIGSANGKAAFNNSIKSARDDNDKINSIATVVLANSSSVVKNDFMNQKQGINSLNKAIDLIKKGTQTGVLDNAKQYAYNVVGKDFDPNLAAINAYITSAIQPYRNSITGAAWGEQEDSEYMSLFGSTKYSPAELLSRLERIKEIMNDKTISALDLQVNPMGGANIFNVGMDTSTTSTGELKPQYEKMNFDLSYDEALKKYGEDGLKKIIGQ